MEDPGPDHFATGSRTATDPFHPMSNTLGNARMNSLGNAHGHSSMSIPQQQQQQSSQNQSASATSSLTLGSRASSCNERKVAPGPPPRTSALSKLENKNDKSSSVPNLNVYVNQEQRQNLTSGLVENVSDIPKPAPLKRNNSLIRLFSRKSSQSQFAKKDPGSPMKKLSSPGPMAGRSQQQQVLYGNGGSESSTPNLNSRHNSISSHASSQETGNGDNNRMF